MKHLRCPYCKISFTTSAWAGCEYPRVVCVNCRNYSQQAQTRQAEVQSNTQERAEVANRPG